MNEDRSLKRPGELAGRSRVIHVRDKDSLILSAAVEGRMGSGQQDRFRPVFPMQWKKDPPLRFCRRPARERAPSDLIDFLSARHWSDYIGRRPVGLKTNGKSESLRTALWRSLVSCFVRSTAIQLTTLDSSIVYEYAIFTSRATSTPQRSCPPVHPQNDCRAIPRPPVAASKRSPCPGILG